MVLSCAVFLSKVSAWVSTLCRHPPRCARVRNIRAFDYPGRMSGAFSCLFFCFGDFFLGWCSKRRVVSTLLDGVVRERAGPLEKNGEEKKAGLALKSCLLSLSCSVRTANVERVRLRAGFVSSSRSAAASTAPSVARQKAEKYVVSGPEYASHSSVRGRVVWAQPRVIGRWFISRQMLCRGDCTGRAFRSYEGVKLAATVLASWGLPGVGG